MFDLSLAEVALVILVAVVFIGPKELPVVVRAVVKAMKVLRGFMREIRSMMDTLAKESGLDDVRRDVSLIKGDDGQWYESYTVPETKPAQEPPTAGDKP